MVRDHTTVTDSLDRKDLTFDKHCSRFGIIPIARNTADGDAFITINQIPSSNISPHYMIQIIFYPK